MKKNIRCIDIFNNKIYENNKKEELSNICEYIISELKKNDKI